ncbi:malonyl-ACP O-methyltransferase BioC [Haemophilus influenzae]|uniref:malonyl-ACP O-methyltransferase BioC n=1 Tax=Haemophilus influenzae TaxID=727 RepID=UPI000E0CE1F1|nr:malonyl-ACP O-methyltransferase BioC [Haemophilus influenzae]
MGSLTSVDKSRIRQAFQKALNDYDRHALIQQKMTINLVAHLQDYLPNGSLDSVLELGCGSGMLSSLLQKQISADYWLFNDLCDVQAQLAEKLPQSFDFHCGDAEHFLFLQQFDLIASASAVQWFHQPDAFIAHCKTGLKTNGLLAVATFCEDNLKEVRQITNIGLNYPTLSQWQTWLAKDFELLWCEDFKVILDFDTPLDVLKHLKYTGVTATNQKNWTRKNLNKFIDDYLKAFSLPSGKVRLTYHPLFFIARYSHAKNQ